MELPQTRLTWRDALIVMLLFASSTLLYALLGIRFDARPLDTGMQFMDVKLLADNALESLWYYHANPPLLNLFAAVGVKLFGEQPTQYFTISFHLLGLLASLSIYALTLKLSASRLTAVITTGLLVFSPSFVLYENWLFYSFPAMALLAAATMALYKYVETGRTQWCAAFFGVLCALLLTRSLFHLAWMMLVAGVLAVLMRERWRQVLLAAVFPVLLVALWCGKNYYYFGSFSASSWMGLGVANISTYLVTRAELEPLVHEGTLSRWALVSRYQETKKLFESQLTPPTGVAVLDNAKKANGKFNYNYRDLPVINDYYTADAFKVIRAFPERYAEGVWMANRLYFSPTSMNLYFNPANRSAAYPMDVVFNPLLFGARAAPKAVPQVHYGVAGRYSLEVNASASLALTWWALIVFGCVQAWRGLRSGNSHSRPRAIVMAFISGTAIYLYVVSTTIEMAENYRYRFLIEPLMFALAGTAIAAAIATYRRSRQERLEVSDQSKP